MEIIEKIVVKKDYSIVIASVILAAGLIISSVIFKSKKNSKESKGLTEEIKKGSFKPIKKEDLI